MNPEKTVAFTGHRPEKIFDGKNENSVNVQKIKHLLRQAIYEKIEIGCDCFITGMAMGVDLWAAEIVLEFQKEKPYITLVAAIPGPEQDKQFPAGWKARYQAVLSLCSEVHTITPQLTKGSFSLRNRWMVEHAEHLIGIYNGSRGGTMQTINMALLRGADVKIIPC